MTAPSQGNAGELAHTGVNLAIAARAVSYDMSAQGSFADEAQPLQQSLRRGIAGVEPRPQPLDLQIRDGKFDDRLHRLARIAVAPISAAEEEAHFGAVVMAIDIGEIAGADDVAVARQRH